MMFLQLSKELIHQQNYINNYGCAIILVNQLKRLEVRSQKILCLILIYNYIILSQINGVSSFLRILFQV